MKKNLNNDEISSLKKLIEEQKNKISQLKTIIDDLPVDVYWKKFSNRKLIYSGMNRTGVESLQKMGFKWKKEDILGKSDDDLFNNETANIFFKNDWEVIQSSVSQTREETAFLPSGKKLIQLSTKRPLFDTKGNIVGISGVSIDISELKETQTALQIALEKAEAANQAKTEFLENMRHDIRTPLSGIVGCAHLIQSEVTNPNVKRYVDDLVESSDALLEFLNKILESIQVATGEIPLLKKKFSLYQLVEQVVRLNQSQADVKNLHLHFDYDENIPLYLLGDPVRLQRIVLELVANALKYTDQGEVKISARLVEKKDQKITIELRIRDTGIGIPRDKQDEIYTRFRRLTPSYQGIYSGAGLGLSVIKQFIDDIEGEIQLNSHPNHGSTFTCFIPLQESLSRTVDEDEAEETVVFTKGAHIVTKKVTEAKEMPETTGNRVLVVEDNPIAARVARGVLLELNCQIDIAKDGETALTLVEKNHYDLVLMDIGLPDGDGCDVTRRIRLKQWQSNPGVPIVGLTAHIVEEKKKSCLENGMNAIYSKPLTSEKASEILIAFVSRSEVPVLKETQAKATTDNLPLLPLLDKEKAIALLGSEEILDEVLELLVKDLTNEIAELKQYHQNKDWKAIGRLAHKWKGGTSYCGASRLEYVCKEAQTVLKAESPKNPEILYQQLLQVAEETKEATKKEMDSK